MDNLSAHGGGRVGEIVERRDCEAPYLPPSEAPPDLNPIEEAFFRVKQLLCAEPRRTREALIEAMDRAPDALMARDARGFFDHCGYRPMGQLLW